MTASIERISGLLAESRIVETHFHVGPEVIPRRYDMRGLATAVAGCDATLVAKNHMASTTSLAALARARFGARILGGIVLNHFVGGLNPHAVRAAAATNRAHVGGDVESARADPPFVVWMPTVHAAAHLRTLGHEFDPRWSGCCASRHDHLGAVLDPADGISAFDARGRPAAGLEVVLDAIARAGAVLATGHLAADETMRLVPLAIGAGVRSIIVTHPHYPSVQLSDAELVDLAGLPGVHIEHCFAIHTIEGVPLETLASSILATGPDRVILSTDFGQLHSPDFPEGSERYAVELLEHLGGELGVERVVDMFTTTGARALALAAGGS